MDPDRPLGFSRPAAPPIYPASVYTLEDVDALDRIVEGRADGYIYARDRHPNAQQLADALAAHESARWGLIAASGMGAIVGTLLALLRQGDRVLASDQLYGRTTQFLNQELSRFGVETHWVDSTSIPAVRAALAAKPRVLLVESISNPMLRVADVEPLAALCRRHDCALVVDNTFATPVLARPLEHGAAACVESLTKLIGGHSDVTLGAAFGNDDNLQKQLGVVFSVWGMAPGPFDCWLAQRSIPTMPLRVLAAVKNAIGLAEWLRGQPGVARVIYPGLPDHPDHALAAKSLPLGPGNMVTIELDGGRGAVNRFMRRAAGIPFSPSLGDTHTTCSYPAGTSHRYVDPADKKRIGITDGLLRLSVGIEPFDDLCREVRRGL
jgi:cystathionine beta-lyase/cystathionine gamma-synthase